MSFLYENLLALTWQQVTMWAIGGVLIYLAIKKDMEPSLLLPIGFAALHEDNIALKQMQNIYNNFVLIDKLNIYEIMNLIANSYFFAGTSLHGNITAMSFGIRHIGLNPEIKKLENYLKTWEIKRTK